MAWCSTRVIDGFMAQGGDPTGTGMGGSKKPNLRAEFNDVSHQRGICSMARSSDPNSANSQFFICLDDASFLDRKLHGVGQSRERHGRCRRAAEGRAAEQAGQDRLGENCCGTSDLPDR